MRPHYDLVDLDLFLNVARCGNLTRGAAAANLSTGPASVRIRKLEAALDVTLFERGRAGVKLTSAGRELLRRAPAVFAQLDGIHHGLHAADVPLRLWMTASGARGSLPDALADFLRRNVQAQVDVAVETPEVILSALRSGTIDIAASGSAGDMPSVAYQRDPLVAAMRADHPLAHAGTVDFAQLAGLDFLTLGEGSANHAFLMQAETAIDHPLRIRLRLSSLDTLLAMVARGMGIALLPSSVVEGRDDLRLVPLRDEWALRETRLFCPAPSPATRRLLAALCDWRDRHHPISTATTEFNHVL